MLPEKCLHCSYCIDDDEALYCEMQGKKTVSPVCWVGGKYSMAGKLVGMFPEHTCYAEVFGGAAHILFKKPLSAVEVYNDIDGRLVNFFRVMKDYEKNKQLQLLLNDTLYARQVFNECKTHIGLTDIEKAYEFIVINKMSFGAKMGTWGVDIGGAGQVRSFNNLPEKIDNAFCRMKKVQVENSDFEYILKKYDRPETFFYLDPPYCFSGARSKDKLYDYEMTDNDHERLIDRLLTLTGKAMLSGYETPIYDRLINAGWKRVDVGESNIAIKLTMGKERMKKREYVWVNY